MEKYLLPGQRMFADWENSIDSKKFKKFIENNIGGEDKLKTFADLMGLEFSGYRRPSGEFVDVGEEGYAWVSRLDDERAVELTVNSIYTSKNY